MSQNAMTWNSQRGFTLLEAAVSLSVVSLLLVAVVAYVIQNEKTKAESQGLASLEQLTQTLIAYVSLSQRLPCGSTDTRGLENCGAVPGGNRYPAATIQGGFGVPAVDDARYDLIDRHLTMASTPMIIAVVPKGAKTNLSFTLASAQQLPGVDRNSLGFRRAAFCQALLDGPGADRPVAQLSIQVKGDRRTRTVSTGELWNRLECGSALFGTIRPFSALIGQSDFFLQAFRDLRAMYMFGLINPTADVSSQVVSVIAATQAVSHAGVTALGSNAADICVACTTGPGLSSSIAAGLTVLRAENLLDQIALLARFIAIEAEYVQQLVTYDLIANRLEIARGLVGQTAAEVINRRNFPN